MAELKLTRKLKKSIVESLSNFPNLTYVCKAHGISTRAVHRRRKKDPKFDADVAEALELGYDGLEAEAIRRGKDGVRKPIFYKGFPVMEVGSDGKVIPADVREYSDVLLLAMLKAQRPKRFNPGAKLNIGEGGQKVSMTFNIGGEDENS